MPYGKSCTICNKQFIARFPHQLRCSTQCIKLHHQSYCKHRRETDIAKTCQICSKEFIPNKFYKSVCSGECKIQNQKLKSRESQTRIKQKRAIVKICKFCFKEFNTQKSTNEFCDLMCWSRYHKKNDVTLICGWCGEEFVRSYIKRRRRFCSKKCSTSFVKHNWDAAAVGKKISKTLKEDFAFGKRIHPWIGRTHTTETKQLSSRTHKERKNNIGVNNPMHGKNHSKESREKMSRTRTRKILNGDYASWFKKGVYHSIKSNKDVVYRSSWELSVFQFLDYSDDVLSYEVEPFSINYFLKINKRYIPDILISYKNGITKLVEIKPFALIKHVINQAKFNAAKEYCDQNNIKFEVWSEQKIAEINTMPIL